MKNATESDVVIKMRHIDNADRLAKCLKRFCDIAGEGGDAELFINHNGTMKDCGSVGHDLIVVGVVHAIKDGKS